MTSFTPSFNQIAAEYDRQRAHPPEVSAAIGTAIAEVAGAKARVLELGVGTGRIAFPVAAAGPRVVGIDLAIEMLRRAQAGGLDRLVRGDITSLPFRSTTFDAVLAVHVLHLVADWRGVLAEAIRVLRSTGMIIQGRDWRDPQSCAALLRSKLREAVIAHAPGTKPPAAGAATSQALARLGATTTDEIVAASWTTQITPAAILDSMARRDDAETWALPDDVLESALADVRAWAATTWDDLDARQPVEQRFVLSVTRGAWGEKAR
jgi:ubiquinone/menaquinone biosynthesis C-methylase UbiE